jgi:hypothetical protein
MLCQAVLVAAHPRLQCLPVGMPDGGRDAVSADASTGEKLIYQVKFARRPERIVDTYKWITDAIKGELPKVEKLVSRGASEYCLVTNVTGSSHLDVGLIDKVQKYLDEMLPIPGRCMWRDDLDRRLDGNFDLKLQYPSLLTGPDMARLLWERVATGSESKSRSAALKAFMNHQFDQDETVRFKQADLNYGSLFKIFIDVPVRFMSARKRRQKEAADSYARAASRAISRRKSRGEAEEAIQDFSGDYFYDEQGDLVIYYRDPGGPEFWTTPQIGAADLLLDSEFLDETQLIVLEGAPGQGKSTLTQYIAQVHRARLLQRGTPEEIDRKHYATGLYIPLRIELRDLATWLNGVNPWAKDKDGPVSHDKPLTLEGALAGLIDRYSGGLSFNVADVHAVVEESSTILLLDGLDEVADQRDRHRVVDAVVEGARRLAGMGKRFAAIVTSRPSAIASMPAFPKERFQTFALGAIDRNLALDYTDRWSAARGLSERDHAEVRSILVQKMDAPHMADLARNTMQLSILLNLIYLQGSSLPDKRTELYYTYVETFLNRESEKSDVVRRYRRLLVEIHCYLGFHLHAAAERDGGNGRIRFTELKRLITEYLVSEGRPVEIVDELLRGAVDRVVALVSRVEGTYEFEVQPLREYFAAKYLYETASYSPAGRESPGTKPDRFDALAPNSYWQNVVRFYAGCFSKGELLDLAERICDLIRSPSMDGSLYARFLALSLLQDWVLTQSIRATREVIETVFDDSGLRALSVITRRQAMVSDTNSNFMLTEDAGREVLSGVIWQRLKHIKSARMAGTGALGTLLARHYTGEELIGTWRQEALRRKGPRRLQWLLAGRGMGLAPYFTMEDVRSSSESIDDFQLSRRLAVATRAGMRLDLLDEEEARLALIGLVEFPSGWRDQSPPTTLTALAELINPVVWVHQVTGRRFHRLSLDLKKNRHAHQSDLLGKVDTINALAFDFISGDSLQNDIGPWVEIIEMINDVVGGDSCITLELGVVAASINAPEERGAGVKSIFDDVSLPHRLRNARRRGNQEWWWREQGEAAINSDRAYLWILALLTWAEPAVIVSSSDLLNATVRRLDERRLISLYRAVGRGRIYSARSRKPLPSDFSRGRASRLNLSTLSLLAGRLPKDLDKSFVLQRLSRGKYWHEASAWMKIAHDEFGSGRMDLDVYLSGVRKAYQVCQMDGFPHQAMERFLKDASAHEAVRAEPWSYPEPMLASSFSRNPEKVRAVMDIADENGWFRK